MQDLVSAQESRALKRDALIRELFVLAVPYMITAVLGYSQQIYNAILLPMGLKMHYPDTDTISTIISATTYVGVKITAIPMVLAPGFTAAIIPHITSALTENNLKLARKNVIDCLNVILFIGLPVSFCIFLYAAPINYTLFYTEDLATTSMVLRWMTLEAIMGMLGPVVTNLMLALNLKSNVLKRLVINAVLKGILLVPMTAMMGFGGSVLASFIADGYLILSNLNQIRIEYKVNYKRVFNVLARVAIVIVAMWIVSSLLNMVGLSGVEGRKIIAFVLMCLNGLLTVGAGALVAIFLRLPDTCFHVHIGRKR